MSVTISGTNGIDKVQDGTIQSADFAAGVPARSNLPAGTVLQVVTAQTGTAVSTTSTSNVTTGLQATITPSSTTNKILVIASAAFRKASGVQWGMGVALYNGSNQIFDQAKSFGYNTTGDFTAAVTATTIDSPATTSAVTYSLRFRAPTGGTGVFSPDNDQATITLMEIAA